MKKLLRFFVVFTAAVGLSVLFSSYSSPAPVLTMDNNGVDVQVFKDGYLFGIGVTCGDESNIYWSDKCTVQFKDGITHMVTAKIQLPKDLCIVPSEEEGVVRWDISENFYILITPSGMAIWKEVYSPPF